VRTLIVSDLHLGSPTGADVLRDPEPRGTLLDAVRGADRVVLLGDLLELRDSATEDALGIARPFFEDLGAMLSGSELVLIAGNHDHALVAPWLARRELNQAGTPLQLEQRVPVDASPILTELSQWVQPARLEVSYPGLWVREDVYATHGHYLDCHMGITSGERLVIALMSRLQGRSTSGLGTLAGTRGGPRSVKEYEAVTGPAYRSLDKHALLRRAAYSRVMSRVGRRLAGVSHAQLVRAETTAMGEVAARLGLGDAHVVFGHTHRPGPLADEDLSRWQGRNGARLINCGCWLEHALRSASAPFLPCVLVEGSDPPVLVRSDAPLARATQGPEQAQ
jgi:predicted phosphodiesterase